MPRERPWREMGAQVCLIVAFLLLGTVHASHFRGGILSWKPVNNSDTDVEIFYRISWRRSWNTAQTHCDKTTIVQNTLIGIPDPLRCFTGCTQQLGLLKFYCTDFSIAEDWVTGTNRLTVSLPRGGLYEIGYTGGNWIRLQRGGGGWSVRMTINLSRHGDSNRVNTSPITNMPPIVVMQKGCTDTIVIPVNDDDGDIVRCRWANSSKNECGGVCNAFTEATLHQDECKLDVSSSTQIGWYAVAVMIEDFANLTASTPLSSIPLQFLVHVVGKTENCTSEFSPKFKAITRQSGSCIAVGGTYRDSIVAYVPGKDIVQTGITTTSPRGLITGSPTLVAGTTNVYSVSVEWTPDRSQVGSHIFCFRALFGRVAATEQRCVTFVVGVTPPKVIKYQPQGKISVNDVFWTVKFNSRFQKQTDTRYIYLYEVGVNEYVHKIDASGPDVTVPTNMPQTDFTITIFINYTLQTGSTYYILHDPGIVKGIENCGVESERLSDPETWRVVVDSSAPERSVCSRCEYNNGLYLFRDPNYCYMYQQCVKAGHALVPGMLCPFGQFWNNKLVSCTTAIGVNCDKDPCAGDNVKEYDHHLLCSAYWECQGDKTVGAKCCESGYAYKPGQGCVPDANCSAACPPKEMTVICDLKAHGTDPSKYLQYVNGHYLTRDCAIGTEFNEKDCECSAAATGIFSPIQDCDHTLYIPFDRNIYDVERRMHVINSRSKVKAGRKFPPSGVVGQGAGKFNGKSKLSILGFGFFGHELLIRFQFLETSRTKPVGDGKLENLFGNGDCGKDGSIGVKYDRLHNKVIGKLHTAGQASITASVAVGVGNWKHVEYRYDGVNLKLSVNNANHSQPASGNIATTSAALQIGSGCNKHDYYEGYIDEFYVFLCL